MTEASPPPPPRSRRKAAEQAAGPDDEHAAQGFAEAAEQATEETQLLQQQLRIAGVYSGVPDGRYGPATVDAVKRFQSAYGLDADGIAGPRTLEVLASVTGGRVTTDMPTPDGPVQTSAPEPPTEQAQSVAPPEPRPTPAPPSGPVEVILLRSPRDADVVDRLAEAIRSASADVPSRCAAVESLDDPAVSAFDPAALVVACLSQAFLGMTPRTDALERAARSGRVVPLLLEPLELANTPFAGLQALDRGTALSERPDQAAWLGVLGREIAALGQIGAPGRPPSYLPRFSADDLAGAELLERRGKIEFLASVLAAKQLETPLAIGLFGDWGSGKSFFMERLQKRIVALTEASAAAVKAGEQSLYCSHVRHVNFNAWLHSGAADLWPAFAAEVFRGVADPDTRDEQGRTQRRDLIGFRDQLVESEERKERIRGLKSEIAKRSSELHGLEPDTRGAGKLVGTVREIGARLVGLRHGWRDLRAADVLLLVAIGLAIAAFTFFQTPLSWVAAAATGLLAVLRYLDEARRLHRLEAELADEERKQAEYERGAPVEVPPQLLPDFARREAADWAQRVQFDSVTELRMKFDRLSDLITKGLEAREGAGSAAESVPIERVIVYVDDLDRCQHGVVVSVLETLKLLLSLPHFVAVVGVDSRWLFRSLELHFRELLDADGQGTQDDAWAATPQNYLEKIFQYSVVLKPITETGFANLIASLLAPPATDGAAGTGDTGHSAAPPPPADDAGGPAPEAAPQPGAATAGAPSAAASETLDLVPVELVITPEEITFIQGLAPLFETPRAAKRLANVYRLMRVSVGADRLMRDEGFEPALMLLAIGIGFPGLAGEVFEAIRAHPGTSWPDFVKGLPGDDEVHRKLKDRLGRASAGAVADRTLASFEPWIGDVAEFSFHPWQELLPATATS